MATEPCRARKGAGIGFAENVIPFPGVALGSHARRTRARRDWLFGRWAASCLGLPPAAARRYAREIASLEGPPGVPVRRVMADFERAGLPISSEELLDQIDDFHVQADIWARCTAQPA